MTHGSSRRVTVTGLGIITAIGPDCAGFASGLFQGRSGIGPISLFDTKGYPCRLGAEVRRDHLENRFATRETRRISRCDLLGLIAAEEAVGDAGVAADCCESHRAGVVLGGGAGGMHSWERFRRSVWEGCRRPRPSLLLPTACGTLTDLVASRYGFGGVRTTISTACSSSATSVGYAFDLIRSGSQDIVVCGGAESLCELTFSGFNALRLMDPTGCRPFDKRRCGLTLGEGAAILVLEDDERAIKRGAPRYAEVLGYGINSDAYHMTRPDPQGKGMQAAMQAALASAGIGPQEIDYVNAHGTATPVNDRTETLALKMVFGPHAGRLAVSSTKSMVGHCLGASGAVEIAATVLALHRQEVPPTARLESPDPDCDLDYTPLQSRPAKISRALSNSFAFGGNNTAVVLGRALASGGDGP